MKAKTLTLALAIFCLHSGCRQPGLEIPVTPSLEDRTADGGYFNPNTQSFLRGRHWLEKTSSVLIESNGDNLATITFTNSESEHHLRLTRYPLEQLLPRLYYTPASEPDAFDAFNLRLAEFSRNSNSVPYAKAGDRMAHFETSLPESVPWRLAGDYSFVPNPHTRPVRVGLVNNCLQAGLWEITAADRSGEIYHAWFQMPEQRYHQLVASANGLDEDFVAKGLAWSEEKAPLRLDRLRSVTAEYGVSALSIHQQPESRGFSSQDSRRKLSRGYARIHDGNGWRTPQVIEELTEGVVSLSEFVPPGKYDIKKSREFDLGFLRATREAHVRGVAPMTDYNWLEPRKRRETLDYIELTIQLEDFSLVIGNLPLQLLVPQEDFAVHGFGVGVLSSGGIAERRAYLMQDGPAPSYAYLVEPGADGPLALNSHAYGLEQIFIRTHLEGSTPWWEVTLTSYERIVDIIKYRIPIPEGLVADVRRSAYTYVSPLYFTYRDDNLR